MAASIARRRTPTAIAAPNRNGERTRGERELDERVLDRPTLEGRAFLRMTFGAEASMAVPIGRGGQGSERHAHEQTDMSSA